MQSSFFANLIQFPATSVVDELSMFSVLKPLLMPALQYHVFVMSCIDEDEHINALNIIPSLHYTVYGNDPDNFITESPPYPLSLYLDLNIKLEWLSY